MSKWMPDGAGTRAKIGVLTPHLDAVPESEYQAMAPEGVSMHAARVPLGMVGPDGEIFPHVDAEIAKAFACPPTVDEAASLLSAVSPNAIIFAFTSSSYILGVQGDHELKARLERRTKGIPIIVQSAALICALETLQADRIALIHPPWFSDDLDKQGVVYFENQGIEVLEHGQAKLRDDYGDMTPEKITDWVITHTPDNAQVAVIGGGGFRAVGAVGEIEVQLDRPVLSANQAAFWLALRTAGINDNLKGYGRIFEYDTVIC
jgi:maleate isomerase